ncbi:hypothetical protein ANO11243_030100 [Dothideomycetidae sp. 11243]|nr:hypothetical protein ANO11243_030100 [fungal sp. No.11243]
MLMSITKVRHGKWEIKNCVEMIQFKFKCAAAMAELVHDKFSACPCWGIIMLVKTLTLVGRSVGEWLS